MDYENGHKNIFGLSVLELKKQHNFDFQIHFSMSKIGGILLIFFSLKNIKKGDQLLLLTYLDNFDFLCTLLLKVGPIFDLQF